MWRKWLEIPPWKIEAECGMPFPNYDDFDNALNWVKQAA